MPPQRTGLAIKHTGTTRGGKITPKKCTPAHEALLPHGNFFSSKSKKYLYKKKIKVLNKKATQELNN